MPQQQKMEFSSRQKNKVGIEKRYFSGVSERERERERKRKKEKKIDR